MNTSYRPTGLIRYHSTGAYRGYTLFSPNGGNDAYLIDMEGRFVHRWHHPGGIAYGYLLNNGNLLFRDQGSNPPGADHIRELDWDGRLVWEHRDPCLRRHHRLPNGNNLLLLQRDRISADLTRKVRGGYATVNDPERMLGDQVVEVAPDGTEVNVWSSADHLDPATDVICPLERRDAWGSANDLTASPDGSAFLISFRILDTVALVDRSTGKIAWKWGPGNISHQHHPTYLDNGNVLLLDNGSHRRGLSYSRVIEVDPSTGEIVWQYQGMPMVSFFTHFTGGAQRLPNGNTLITEGQQGRLFEVTPANEIVWEYVSPFVVPSQFGMANAVFRAHRYGPDHPALQGRDLEPNRLGNLNRLYGGSTGCTGEGRKAPHPNTYLSRAISQHQSHGGGNMYNKAMLSLEQAQNAITAMIADFNRDPDRRKVDMAVVDDAGNLLAYARMDRCLRPTFAIRKAYTSAVRSMDTAAFAEQLSSTGRSIESFGDPQLIAIPGGVTVFHEGVVVGAIGVGGLPSGFDDEAIAKAGVAALGI